MDRSEDEFDIAERELRGYFDENVVQASLASAFGEVSVGVNELVSTKFSTTVNGLKTIKTFVDNNSLTYTNVQFPIITTNRIVVETNAKYNIRCQFIHAFISANSKLFTTQGFSKPDVQHAAGIALVIAEHGAIKAGTKTFDIPNFFPISNENSTISQEEYNDALQSDFKDAIQALNGELFPAVLAQRSAEHYAVFTKVSKKNDKVRNPKNVEVVVQADNVLVNALPKVPKEIDLTAFKGKNNALTASIALTVIKNLKAYAAILDVIVSNYARTGHHWLDSDRSARAALLAAAGEINDETLKKYLFVDPSKRAVEVETSESFRKVIYTMTHICEESIYSQARKVMNAKIVVQNIKSGCSVFTLKAIDRMLPRAYATNKLFLKPQSQTEPSDYSYGGMFSAIALRQFPIPTGYAVYGLADTLITIADTYGLTGMFIQPKTLVALSCVVAAIKIDWCRFHKGALYLTSNFTDTSAFEVLAKSSISEIGRFAVVMAEIVGGSFAKAPSLVKYRTMLSGTDRSTIEAAKLAEKEAAENMSRNFKIATTMGMKMDSKIALEFLTKDDLMKVDEKKLISLNEESEKAIKQKAIKSGEETKQ